MALKYKPRDINSGNMAWHTELGENDNADDYSEWLWIDGQSEIDEQSESVHHFSLAWYWARPNQGESGEGGNTPVDSRWPAMDS